MTDITDQDRRDMLEWARIAVDSKDNQEHEPWVTAARYILATVDAPAPTLADEIRGLPDFTMSGDNCISDCHERADDVAFRVEQMEHDLADARAEVGLLTVQAATAEQDRKLAWRAMDKACGEKGDAIRERDEARAEVKVLAEELAGAESEVERLTAVNEQLRLSDNFVEFLNKFLTVQKGTETPDPADVKPGEAWIVECRGERRTAVKDRDDTVPWCTVNADGWFNAEKNADVTLVSRLVPAPRVITNTDELDRMPEGTIVRDNRDGIACQKNHHGFWDTTMGDDTAAYDASTFGPVTVLWEPEA
ncbi:hypothetical protein [Corynebacterium nuruki]|uniref:hypothetical protein n=1 Tax=Corynebacterium nuruki TaxID=1032851 RepID=UPI0039BEF6D7